MSNPVADAVCVHRLFERQAARAPDDVALSCGDRRMTYRELDERANRLAHYLLRHRTAADSLVGICLERSPETIVALLGVWKAGAAYVPLDPSCPCATLAFEIRDAGLRLVLTQDRLRHLVAESGIETICLDTDWADVAQERAENPESAGTNGLACVMYTAQATGRPEGVMIGHRSLASYVCWAADAYGFKPGGIVPVHSSMATGLAVTSVYPPLLVGGCLELLPEDAGMPELVGALKHGTRYNVVKIAPAQLESLNRQLAPHEMACFAETLVIAGGQLLAENLRLWRQFAHDTRLVNEFGRAETVVGCCAHEVRPFDPQRGPVPIGGPIANTTLQVLDGKRNPLPAGVAGELYIGGSSVARGYLNLPALTAERFLADPSSAGGARLYKSGDLVRRRADGIYEYLGRIADADGERDAGRNPGHVESDETPASSPLSFGQEHLWFLHQQAPNSPVGNIADVIRFGGGYHAVALLKAVKELTRRHGALRTFFSVEQGRPVQVVSDAVDGTVAQVDLSSVPPLELEAAWRHVVRQEVRRPFDLSEPPLLRWLMVHLSATDHRLLLTVHRIVADEWSMNIVRNEIACLYAAFSEERESPLPKLPIQYADFARRQRNRPQEEEHRLLTYWREALAGAATALDLPIDKPRPPAPSLRGATEYIAVGKELCGELKALGRRADASFFVVLEAAFMSLLHRYTGQDDILVGTPVASRTQSETLGLIGCFLNTVVLRARFDERLTFNGLLRRVREQAAGGEAHAEILFRRLVAEIAPQSDPGRTPLFQAMFMLHDTRGSSSLSKLAESRELETGTSQFELSLIAAESEDGGLEVLIEYSTDLFVAATAQRMCRHYLRLLAAIAHDPDEAVDRLPMLSEPERQTIEQWNPPPCALPSRPLHRLIEAQAAKTPERIAVAYEAQTLCYADLNRRANQLAHYLREQGVGPEVLVGIHLERPIEMAIALLAVQKAGGAYVPLDPDCPPRQLAGILAEAAPAIVLTHASCKRILAPGSIRSVDLDDIRQEISRYDEGNPDVDIGMDALACVIFPPQSAEGVEVAHGSLVNLLEAMGQTPGLAPADVMLSATPLAFGGAAPELFLPLVKGARVVLCSREDALDGARLTALLAASGATAMQAAPATWRMLIDAGWTGTPGLKLLCGGDTLTRDLADALLSRAAEVWNLYGAAETTVWSSVWRVERGSDAISIGRPLANAQMWVLDAGLEPVPVGVVGQLCVGGAGVARGYRQRAELTAERFLPDTLSGIAGARLFRTGDRARWLPDGRLECLGRPAPEASKSVSMPCADESRTETKKTSTADAEACSANVAEQEEATI